MSKYELDGFRPQRPWMRGIAYLIFIAVVVVAWYDVQPGVPSGRILLYIVALVVSFIFAAYAYWNARVTARLRRRGHRPVRVKRGFAPAPFPFTDQRDTEWPYFADKAPTNARS